MKLRVLAPCRTHLCLRTGALSHRDAAYARLWGDLAQRWEEHEGVKTWNGASVEAAFPHAVGPQPVHGIEYVSIDQRSRQRSPELLRVSAALRADTGDGTQEVWDDVWATTRSWAEETDDLEADLARLRQVVHTAAVPFEVHLFDNTLGILTADVDLDSEADAWRERPAPLLDLLRVFANAFADRLLAAFYGDYLRQTLEMLASWEPAGRHQSRFLRSIGASHTPDDVLTTSTEGGNPQARILWAARCLDLSSLGDDPVWKRLARLWLQDVGQPRDVERELRRIGVLGETENIKEPGPSRAYSLRWLHYLRRPPLGEEAETTETRDAESFEGAWSVMIEAQYHYATLDVLNTHLNRVIGRSYLQRATHRVSRLHDRLEELMSRTDLLIVSYRDWQKYLPRRQLQVLQEIMTGWDFESIIEQSRRKTELCAGRIETLHKKSVARSAFIIDVALIVIGFLSFVSLFLELSQYGRSLLETEGRVDLLARLFSGSTDLLLIIALSLILLLTVLYGFFRRKSLL